MTKAEIATFIEEMETIGDIWTEEQVRNVYEGYSLRDALKSRKAEVGMFLNALGTAALYIASKEAEEEQ